MPDTQDVSSPKPGLPPHIWAMISAVTVALIGGAVTLTTVWLSHPHAPASTASTAAPPGVSVAADPTPHTEAKGDPGLAALNGHWKGKAQAAGQPAQTIEVQITGDCASGAHCGWIAVPDVPCKGQITLLGPAPDGFEFRVDRFDAASDAQKCQPGGGEVLRATDDGTVDYRATYSGARGVLRPAP